MKPHLLILSFLSCFSSLYAQVPVLKKQIDSSCKVIDRDGGLKKKIYEQEAFMDHATDNGGSLTVYYKNKTVYKIEEWVGLSGYVVINTYYFQNNQVVFVKDEEYMYERNPITGETTGKFSKDNRFIGKYYFKNGKLIDQESLGHNRFEDDDNDPEQEFNRAAKKISSAFQIINFIYSNLFSTTATSSNAPDRTRINPSLSSNI